ncbi:MAG: hypothetical protein PVI23_02420 [Maricaulaceae bacterium]
MIGEAELLWIWTHGGESFGYRDGDDLWSFDGRHVGRFHGAEAYAPDGRYLGEFAATNRLLTVRTKRGAARECFIPFDDREPLPPRERYARYELPADCDDFPTPDKL